MISTRVLSCNFRLQMRRHKQSLFRVAACTLALSAVAAHAQIHFQLLKQEVIEERLRAYKGTDFDREAELKKLFAESSCKPELLSEQAVKNKQPPNVICTLPGATTMSFWSELTSITWMRVTALWTT